MSKFDVLFALGFICLTMGLYSWSPHMTFIIDGIILMVLAVLGARTVTPKQTGE